MPLTPHDEAEDHVTCSPGSCHLHFHPRTRSFLFLTSLATTNEREGRRERRGHCKFLASTHLKCFLAVGLASLTHTSTSPFDFCQVPHCARQRPLAHCNIATAPSLLPCSISAQSPHRHPPRHQRLHHNGYGDLDRRALGCVLRPPRHLHRAVTDTHHRDERLEARCRQRSWRCVAGRRPGRQ